MDASSPTIGFLISRHFAVCWLLICALIWGAGCASSGGKSTGAQATTNSIFKTPFEKKKPREIVDPDAGFDEYDLAMARFEKKEYDEAAKQFKAIAKKYYDYPVEEDALYMVAESRFAAGRYAWAQDGYDGLIKKFPSSRYLEKSTRRLYAIAAIWLNGDGSTKTEELVQVSATDVTKPDAVQRKKLPNSIPLVPNLFDKSRPLFDTTGNALKALKSVWLHDPLGPLADDALMLTAVYHIRKGQLRDADHYLDVLRREYPKSEHTQTAFVVGSHIKLASYQGPRYDGRDLVDADDLIHSTLNLYPDLPDRDELKTELVKIRDQGAERHWSRAEYYRRRDKPQSEAIYLESILKDFPESAAAEKAAKRLQELGPKYWTGMLDHYPTAQSGGKPASPRASASPPPASKKPATARPQKRQTAAPPAKLPPESESKPESDNKPESGTDDAAEPYEELPPAKTRVDEPELVNESSDSEIERTKFDGESGRARP